MAATEVVRAFDEISRVYDDTRSPLGADTMAAVVERLRAHGVRDLLEVGVGTGRIARPLTDAGIRVTGVDASRGMLAKARTKNLDRLVRGNAYRLPIAGGSVDGAIFAHVLHLLDDPVAALREAQRVARAGAFALVHRLPDRAPDGLEGSRGDPRRIVYAALAREGYPVPADSVGPPTRERALLKQLPPDRLEVVQDREVTEPLGRRIALLERGASRHTLHIPPDVLRRAADEARREIGERTVTFRDVVAVALWSGPIRAPA